jgi:hypothetical protein
MSKGTTTGRGPRAPQPDPQPLHHRRPALPVIIAGLAALVLVTALAGMAAAVGGGSDDARAAAVASPSPSATPSSTPSAAPTPVWQLSSYRRIGFDKTFKADLIDELPSPPELVVFGGSRAMRFSPSYIEDHTGLSAFNNAVQCFRPEDAWAFSSYLYSRSPDTRLRCVIALQARTLVDDQMRPGLLYDKRLAGAFPADLVAAQKAALGTPVRKEVLGENRFTSRGFLVRNRYDIARARGYDFTHHIDVSIQRLLHNHAWHGPVRDVRARTYFEKTVQLYNQHDVTPLVIMMPVQPRALRAFRKAGFQRHIDALTSYFEDAQSRVRFRVLDFTEIGKFEGSAAEFYDAVHPTRENARRIMKRAIALAPECFE